MRINVRGVPADGLALAGYVSLERLATEELARVADVLRVYVEVAVRRYVEGFHVKGRVLAHVGMNCSRCLAPFERDVEGTFEMMYQPRIEEKEEEQRENIESDVGITYYTGNEIDLAPEVHQCLLLAIPMQAVCSADCRGLCPGCGVDLNREPCRCAAPRRHQEHATLDDLRRKWGAR